MPKNTKARLDKHDREIAAIRTLIREGMKLVVSVAAAQKQTERSLKAFIDSMKSGGNGHSKTRVQ